MERFFCKKYSTKDNRDGLFVLNLKARPEDMPDEIKHGAYGDRYMFRVTINEDEREFEAIRFTVDDDGKGFVILKVAVLPGQAGDGILYAPNGSDLTVDYEPQLVSTEITPFTPEYRQATFRRLQVVISEPAFWDYLEQFDAWALLTDKFSHLSHRQDAAIEVLYRHIGCHSRSEIRTNAAVCERAERLIRRYRSAQWQKAQKVEDDPRRSAQPNTSASPPVRT
jgi:hypothetical protein